MLAENSIKREDGIVIRKIEFSEVRPLESAARKERVTTANPPGAYWVGAFDGDRIVGFTCVVMNLKTRSARMKSAFVDEKYRRRHIARDMFVYKLNVVKRFGIKVATSFSVTEAQGLVLQYGFKPVHRIGKADVVFFRKVFA